MSKTFGLLPSISSICLPRNLKSSSLSKREDVGVEDCNLLVSYDHNAHCPSPYRSFHFLPEFNDFGNCLVSGGLRFDGEGVAVAGCRCERGKRLKYEGLEN